MGTGIGIDDGVFVVIWCCAMQHSIHYNLQHHTS